LQGIINKEDKMSLYLKYRPNSFEEVVGNSTTVKTLQAILHRPDPPHTFLLFGPTGCGKTTLARIIAASLGCKGIDYHEIDTADYRGIDTIRDIRKMAHLSPMESQSQVWVLDECHKLSNDAQNALLKILEDTPKKSYFILCTTDAQKLLPTIRNRCSQFEVRPLQRTELYQLIFKIVGKEQTSLSEEAFEKIFEISKGIPRAALVLLEQVLALEEKERMAALESDAFAVHDSFLVINLCKALLLPNTPWRKISYILKELRNQQEDPEVIKKVIIQYCTTILLKQEDTKAALLLEILLNAPQFQDWPGLVLACYTATVAGK
jgi:DNA polymerase-3 subunit gamma/tau